MSDNQAETARRLDESSEEAIRALLLGHRIVSAETGNFDYPGRDSWNRPAPGRLILDDGTQIYVVPNEGGCSCSAGDYELEHLASVDNVITDVRFACEEHDYEQRYRIYVIADATEINALSVTGDDGNGYYGTGYELFVVPQRLISVESSEATA